MNPKQILKGMADRAAELNELLTERDREFKQLMASFGHTVAAMADKQPGPVMDASTLELHFVGKLFRFVHAPSLNLKGHFVQIFQRDDDINAQPPKWRYVGTLEIADGKVADDQGNYHRLDDTEAAALPLWVRVFNAIDKPNGDLA
jgi:hypothetical protein